LFFSKNEELGDRDGALALRQLLGDPCFAAEFGLEGRHSLPHLFIGRDKKPFDTVVEVNDPWGDAELSDARRPCVGRQRAADREHHWPGGSSTEGLV